MVYNVVVKLLWCKIIKKTPFFRFEPIFGSSTCGKLARIPEFTKTPQKYDTQQNITGLVNTVTALSIGLLKNFFHRDLKFLHEFFTFRKD
jgi:hypothetical protein